MAEWLTHVLLMYAIATVGTWKLDWLDSRWVAVAMIGAILPDLSRLYLIVPNELITQVTGLPFHWNGLHTVGGILFLAGIGAMVFVRRKDQKRAFLLLGTGALFHLLVDIPQTYADGLAITNLYFFPISSWRMVTPGWYVPADRWTVVVGFLIAIPIFLLDRYRTRNPSSP